MNKEKGLLFSNKSKHGTEYHWTELDTAVVIEQPRVSYADHTFVLEVLKRISGQMLTLVEASISDKEQRKALKDVVKGFFSEEMNHVSELMYSKEYMEELCQYAEENAPEDLEPVDVEEIIRA
jgi:hypothetical protein